MCPGFTGRGECVRTASQLGESREMEGIASCEMCTNNSDREGRGPDDGTTILRTRWRRGQVGSNRSWPGGWGRGGRGGARAPWRIRVMSSGSVTSPLPLMRTSAVHKEGVAREIKPEDWISAHASTHRDARRSTPDGCGRRSNVA